MMRIENPKEIAISSILVILYSFASILYFAFSATGYYVKNLFGCEITLFLPVSYLILVVIFIFIYAASLNQKLNIITPPIIGMAIVPPLFYLLTELKIGSITMNPFGGERTLYGTYLDVYYLVLTGIFSLLSGNIARKLLKDGMKPQGMVLYAPIVVYFAVIEYMLFTNGLIVYQVIFLALFLIASTSDIVDRLFKTARIISSKTANDERIFIALIFILAFVIRYFWGMRLIGLTGANFIRASDDGPAYDPMAATLASGRILPKETAFVMNGFGYWYFLAAIYKIFGLHNFRAMVGVQAALNASVPVFAYLVGKRVFGSKPIGAIAALFACFNMTLIFLSVVIGMEALYIPLFHLALTAAVYILTVEMLSYRGTFILGSAFGLANNSRGELLFVPFMLAFAACLSMKNKKRVRNMVLVVALIFLGFIAFASIQHIVNYNIYGEYHLAQTAVGTNFTDKRFTDENAMLDEMGFNPFKDLNSSGTFFLRNPILTSRFLLKGFFKRILIYYLQPNFGVFDPLFLVNPASGYLFRFPLYLQFCGYLLILGGFFMAFRDRTNMAVKVFLLSLVVYISSIYAIILLQNSRNRGVLIPIALLFLGYGISGFYNRMKAV